MNRSLAQLDLSGNIFKFKNSKNSTGAVCVGNCIGDQGCLALAEALRSNRTLLQLELSGNNDLKKKKKKKKNKKKLNWKRDSGRSLALV
jgi:hypothetical protein